MTKTSKAGDVDVNNMQANEAYGLEEAHDSIVMQSNLVHAVDSQDKSQDGAYEDICTADTAQDGVYEDICKPQGDDTCAVGAKGNAQQLQDDDCYEYMS